MKEFERRWVIDYPELASEKLEPLCIGSPHKSSVITTYLASNWRLKMVTKNGKCSYYLTKKMPKNADGFREESTIKLTSLEYSSCLDQAPQILGTISYDRLKVLGGTNYEKYGITELCIDRVQGGPVIIEVEFKDNESMINFKILDSMREIKMKGSYKYYLVKKGYCSQ